MRTVDITLLSERVQRLVLAEYRKAILAPDRSMSYDECAWVYGYTHATIRTLVCKRRLKPTGPRRSGYPTIRHQDMQQYQKSKRSIGCTRKAFRGLQTTIPTAEQ